MNPEYKDLLTTNESLLSEIQSLRKQLQASDIKYNMVSQATSDVVWNWNLKNNTLFWNENFERIFGYKLEKGNYGIDFWYEVIHPGDREDVYASIQEAIHEKKEKWEKQYRIRKQDGCFSTVHHRGYIVIDEGKPLYVSGALRDISEEQEAKHAFAELFNVHEFVLDSIPQIVWRAYSNGRADFFNQRWYAYSGLTKEESIEQGWVQMMHPDDLEDAAISWREAIVAGKPFEQEYRLRGRDGNYRWFLGQAMPLYNEHKEVIRWFGSCTDIHDQRETQLALEEAQRKEQQALREAETQHRRLYQILMDTPAPIAMFEGSDYRLTFMNSTFRKVLNPRKMNQGVREIFLDQTSDTLYQYLNQAFTEGRKVEVEEVLISIENHQKTDFRKGYFSMVFQPLLGPDQLKLGVMVVANEITSQVQSRKQVEQHEDILQMALNAGNMATFSLSMDSGDIIRSSNHDRIFGYSENLSAWCLDDYFSHMLKDERKKAVYLINSALKKGEINLEMRILRRDHQIRWVRVQGKVFYDANQQPIYIRGIIADITDQKLSEQQLKEMSDNLLAVNQELATANQDIKFSNEELNYMNSQLKHINADLDNFIYAASHDLRAPITNIEGLVKLLIRKIPQSIAREQDLDQLFDLMRDSIDRFKVTIGDLSEVTKLQKEISEPVERVSLKATIEDVMLDIGNIIEESQADIQVCVDEQALIPFSRKNMRSVVYNLLSNAIKYRSEERPLSVKVTSRKTAEHLVLSVEDNGLGMDLTEGHQLFNMFGRMHDHVEGTGIGLYMVKKIMDNAGGKIEVTSEPDQGTTFDIYFVLQN